MKIRTAKTLNTIEPSAANQVSKQTFGFDDSVPFNNQNNFKEYGFGTGSAGPLMREARTIFVTSSSYTDNGVHLRSLPSGHGKVNQQFGIQTRSMRWEESSVLLRLTVRSLLRAIQVML